MNVLCLSTGRCADCFVRFSVVCMYVVVISLGIGGFVRGGLNFFCQGKQSTASVLSLGGSLFVVFLFLRLFVLSEELSVANSWECSNWERQGCYCVG